MTTTAHAPSHRRSPTARHFTLAVLALSMGGFTIGTTEFVTMGLIREIADGVDVSIPSAGHVISAYALGSSSARRCWRSSAPAGRGAGCWWR